jgi:hypothetical protein
MNRYNSLIGTLLVATLIFSCSSPRVITYAHASAEFDQYRTFRVKPHTEVEALSRKGHETYQRLDSLIAGQMTARGYQLSHEPDLVIDYEISTGLSQNTPSQYYDRYPYNWYYPTYNYGAPPQDVEAMVEIEMIQRSSKKTVWTGSSDLILKPRRDDNLERIEQHILEIFSRFEYSAK